MRGRAALALAVLASVPLGACGATADDALPDGTVVLVQNIPTDVDGVEMVGVNIDGDSGAIASPEAPDGRVVPVVEGDVVTLGPVTVTVVAVREGGDDADEPGRGDGWIGVLPED